MIRDAVLSADGLYRYRLSRLWDRSNPTRVAFVMLNPSTADADIDDPTIRRCAGYGDRWGYGALDVVNLYPYRSTDPRALLDLDAATVNGNVEEHLDHVADVLRSAGLVVGAWGAGYSPVAERVAQSPVFTLLDEVDLYRIGPPTMGGEPRHPLYLRSDLELERADR